MPGGKLHRLSMSHGAASSRRSSRWVSLRSSSRSSQRHSLSAPWLADSPAWNKFGWRVRKEHSSDPMRTTKPRLASPLTPAWINSYETSRSQKRFRKGRRTLCFLSPPLCWGKDARPTSGEGGALDGAHPKSRQSALACLTLTLYSQCAPNNMTASDGEHSMRLREYSAFQVYLKVVNLCGFRNFHSATSLAQRGHQRVLVATNHHRTKTENTLPYIQPFVLLTKGSMSRRR